MQTIRAVIIALTLSGCLAGCTSETGPITTPDLESTEVAVSMFEETPTVGGNTSSVTIIEPWEYLGAVDGRIYRPNGAELQDMGYPGSDFVKIYSDGYVTYAVTPTDFVKYSFGTGSIVETRVPIPIAGADGISGQIVDVSLKTLAQFEPLVVITTNLARSYAYYSTNTGSTWPQLKFTSKTGPVNYLSPPGDVTHFSGLSFFANGSSSGGLYRTENVMAGWSPLSGIVPDAPVKLLVSSDGFLYTWTPGVGGLRVSKDEGSSFQDLTQQNQYPLFTHVIQHRAGKFYALTADSLVLKSVDYGKTWSRIYSCPANDIAVIDNVIGIAGKSDAAGNGGGIHHSENGGNSWKSSGLKAADNLLDIAFGKDDDLLMIGNQTLFRRTQWKEWKTFGVSAHYERVAANPMGQILVGSADALSYSSDSGTTWVTHKDLPGYSSGGLGPVVITGIVATRSGNFLLAVTTRQSSDAKHVNGALYRVVSGGSPERITTTLTEAITGIAEAADGALYASTYQSGSGSLHKSDDGGVNWMLVGPSTGKVLAINSVGKLLCMKDDGKLTYGRIGEVARLLVPNGGTFKATKVRQARFDKNDVLYFVDADFGLIKSSSPLP